MATDLDGRTFTSRCECISSNEPERGGTVPEVVLTFPFEPDKTVCIDACISEAVQALWRAGIATLGSCCGHGDVLPSVVLAEKENGETARAVLGSVDVRQWTIFAWVLAEMGTPPLVRRAPVPSSVCGVQEDSRP